MSYYREQLEAFLSQLDVKANRVYDIGGEQGHVNRRVRSWKVRHYEVLDIPEWDLNLDWAEDHTKVDKFGIADVVFCLEVFEYLINPIQAMENIKRMLRHDGKAYITFALIYPHHNELEFDSLRYTESGIKRIADLIGLEITNTWYRTDRSGLLDAFYNSDGMRKAKQYEHHNVTGFIVELKK